MTSKKQFRKFEEKVLFVASHNQGKVFEIKDLLTPLDIKVSEISEINSIPPDENGSSFIENAIIKALSSARLSNSVSIADDSGLAINALNGEPGIHSSRWAGHERNFALAINKIAEKLSNTKDMSAKFVCALCLAWPDGHCESFQGEINGSLTFPPKGSNGFGYDPIFIPDGYNLTFGQLDPSKKKAISHRALAFNQLLQNCFK